jgi:hypothetical protein
MQSAKGLMWPMHVVRLYALQLKSKRSAYDVDITLDHKSSIFLVQCPVTNTLLFRDMLMLLHYRKPSVVQAKLNIFLISE